MNASRPIHPVFPCPVIAPSVHTRRALRGHGHSSLRAAFTLIEMVIVIGIIVMLAALTVGVATALTRKSDVRQTENVLKLLDMSVHEWELSADRKLTWGKAVGNFSFDIPSERPGDEQIWFLIQRLNATAATKQILAGIDSKLWVTKIDQATNKNYMTVQDPWDRPIVMLHPGRLHEPTDPAGTIVDNDGTIRTSPAPGTVSVDCNELKLGICSNRRICFISAGPDGELGDLHLDKSITALTAQDRMDIDYAADNIYSYTLSQERP
jgi:prepilin-type N-terminal cleavage/methylation domain-containing protein